MVLGGYRFFSFLQSSWPLVTPPYCLDHSKLVIGTALFGHNGFTVLHGEGAILIRMLP